MAVSSSADAASAVPQRDLERLRRSLRGRLITPEHGHYDRARQVWNGMSDEHRAVIAQCDDVVDVASAIRFGREHDLLTAVGGGGHSVAGFSTCDGGLVVDLSRMKGVEVDFARRRATAAGGVLWGELDRATCAFGLAASAGVVSHTGIAGLTLRRVRMAGPERRPGLRQPPVGRSCDRRRPRRQGQRRGEHGSLLGPAWRRRELRRRHVVRLRHPPVGPVVMAGTLYWPVECATEVWAFYRDWVAAVSDQLSTGIGLWCAPNEHYVPERLRGEPMVAIVLCHAGVVQDGERLVTPLRDIAPVAIDELRPMPYAAVNYMLDVPHGVRSYWKTTYVDELGDDLLTALLEQLATMPSKDSQIWIEHVEGAVARVPDEATAVSHRGARSRVIADALWEHPGDDEQNLAWAAAIGARLKRFGGARMYVKYLADADAPAVRAAYDETKYARLSRLKAEFDPTNFFRRNHNIEPAAGCTRQLTEPRFDEVSP
jgi:FAD/FMN-containing dehydrogenase